MSIQSTVRKTVAVVAVSAIGLVALVAAAGPDTNSVPGRLAQIEATLEELVNAVSPPSPPPNNTTRLLFPFVTAQNGFDTAMVVSNTGLDSTGTVGSAGTCTFHFFGSNAPTPHTVNVPLGQQTTQLASVNAPGFQGYVEVACAFPLAHGFGFLSDLGARNLAATVPALVIPSHRTTSALESAGQ